MNLMTLNPMTIIGILGGAALLFHLTSKEEVILAIIIREAKKIPTGETVTVKQDISDISPLTGDLRKKAEEYDSQIAKMLSSIETELEQLSLFDLRGRPQVLKLWYEFDSALEL